MILQSLVRFYDILASDEESGISMPGYSRTNISYALNISKEGELLEILPLQNKVMRGKKEVDVPQVAIVPEQVKKSSGINPNFLCENSAYTIGIDNKGKPERTKKCFEAFQSFHNELLADVQCDEAVALLNFLNNWQIETALEHDEVNRYKDELMAGANIVFKLDNGAYMHECSGIKNAWDSYKNHGDSGKQMQCLVTGETASIARLNPSIKGVKNAQPSGASLVSFNARSYESYGRDDMQGLNSPISEKAAFAYGTTLNYLIADCNHTLSLGDATIVYWAECAGSTYRNAAALLFSPDKLQADDKDKVIRDDNAEQLVGSILDKISKGDNVNTMVEFQDETNFYVLGLSPNAARVSVRFFMQDTFGKFAKKVAQHYCDLHIEKQFESEPNSIPLWLLLAQTVSPNARDKASSPLLSGSVLRAIINGTAYPVALLNAIMLRIKAEREINYCKAAIIKAYLTRRNYEKYKEVLTMSLNAQSENIAYLLGRLFAVMEKAQQDATPGINATIKDRYFSSASSTPASVFPVLLRLSQHHISKAKYGYASDRLIAEIIEKIDMENNPIPSNLLLEDQGVFVLGYYHQRNDLYTKKTKEVNEEEN
ncbi:MAG: type I-C CRISPR-associated protein Cas8c/Csd1 [Oscillospiraceae bacterium]